MRIETRPVNIYEVDDYVRTGYGVGKVVEVEDYSECFGAEHVFQRVVIQHKYGCSENTSNQPKEVEGFSLISRDEYIEE